MDNVVIEASSVPVPDALLAFTKDDRYFRHLTSLLSNLIYGHVQVAEAEADSDSSNQSDRGSRTVSSLDPEIHLLSRMIFAYIAMSQKTTLGLEHLGISYQRNPSNKRIYIFAALYTIIPYLNKRIGMKGWKKVKLIRRHLMPNFQVPRHLSSSQREQLRGGDRRRIYEEMRRRMIEQSLSDERGLTQSQGHALRTTDSTPQITQRSFKRKILDLFKKMIVGVTNVENMISPIPYFTGNSDSSSNQESDGTSRDNMGKLLKSTIRLNLALFLVNGKYPSILHRLTGLTTKDKPGGDSINIVTDRPEYKAIGIMIILQVGAKGFQAAMETFLNFWYSENHPNLFATALETLVPSSKTRTAGRSNHSISVQMSSATATCGICAGERHHPAASAKCGHVFCWKCIHHWVSSVRQSCPLCRSPTKPQDIIALHSYSP